MRLVLHRTSLDWRGCRGRERAQRTPASPSQKVVLDEGMGNLDDFTYGSSNDHALISQYSDAIAECNQGIQIVGDHDHTQFQLLMQFTDQPDEGLTALRIESRSG